MLSLTTALTLISGVSWFVSQWWNPGRHRPRIVGAAAVRRQRCKSWAVRASHISHHERGISVGEILERIIKERESGQTTRAGIQPVSSERAPVRNRLEQICETLRTFDRGGSSAIRYTAHV